MHKINKYISILYNTLEGDQFTKEKFTQHGNSGGARVHVSECIHVCMWLCLCVYWEQWRNADRMDGWGKSTSCGGLQGGDVSKTSPRPTPVWSAKQSYCWSFKAEDGEEEGRTQQSLWRQQVGPGGRQEAPVHCLGSLASCAVESFDEREMDDRNCGLTTLAVTWEIGPWEKKAERGRASNCSHREERVMGRQEMVLVSREADKLLGKSWVGPGSEHVKSRYGGRRVKSNVSLSHLRLAQLPTRMGGRFLGMKPGRETSKDHYSMSLNKSTQTALNGCPALIILIVWAHYEELEKL